MIREELRARGWVERPLPSTQKAHRCHGNEMDCGADEGLRAGEIVLRTLREILIIIKNQDIFNRDSSVGLCQIMFVSLQHLKYFSLPRKGRRSCESGEN